MRLAEISLDSIPIIYRLTDDNVTNYRKFTAKRNEATNRVVTLLSENDTAQQDEEFIYNHLLPATVVTTNKEARQWALSVIQGFIPFNLNKHIFIKDFQSSIKNEKRSVLYSSTELAQWLIENIEQIKEILSNSPYVYIIVSIINGLIVSRSDQFESTNLLTSEQRQGISKIRKEVLLLTSQFILNKKLIHKTTSIHETVHIAQAQRWGSFLAKLRTIDSSSGEKELNSYEESSVSPSEFKILFNKLGSLLQLMAALLEAEAIAHECLQTLIINDADSSQVVPLFAARIAAILFDSERKTNPEQAKDTLLIEYILQTGKGQNNSGTPHALATLELMFSEYVLTTCTSSEENNINSLFSRKISLDDVIDRINHCLVDPEFLTKKLKEGRRKAIHLCKEVSQETTQVIYQMSLLSEPFKKNIHVFLNSVTI